MCASRLTVLFFCSFFLGKLSQAQQSQTIFGSGSLKHSSGYGAASNKFTRINGEFANMPELYGGWFINHKLLIGLEVAATTNRIPVLAENQEIDGDRVSYQYGQFGLMTEYSIASHKRFHLNVNMVTGAGFLVQYDRQDDEWDFDKSDRKSNFFFLMEPGIQLEANLFKWMRFSPGVSYRRVFGSSSKGLSDNDISGISGNLTLKFGRF